MRGSVVASVLLLLSSASFSKAAALHKNSGEIIDADSGSYHRTWKRQDDSDITMCPLSNGADKTYLSSIYNRFGYIAFNGAELFGYGYELPIAVNGDLRMEPAAGFVGKKYPGTCIADDTYYIDSYAFVHQAGDIDYGPFTPFDAYGNIYLQDINTDKVVPVGENCQIYPAYRNALSFSYAHEGLLAASKYLAELTPDLHLAADGQITSLGSPENEAYQVITLNTCNPPATGDTTCSSLSESQLSDPSGILFFGVDFDNPDVKWPGPDDPSLYADVPTVVINVPVPNGAEMNIQTGIPNIGFDACRLIFNFYPVDSNGEYYDGDDSTFIIRNSVPSSWEGFILGPRGTLESSVSSTGGKLFFNALIDDYKAHLLDFECGVWGGCFPVEDIPQTTIEYSSSTEYSSLTSADHSTTTVTHGATTTQTTTVFTATITHITTATTTELVPTTVSVYVPVEGILENEKEEKWDGKDGEWSGAKDNKWSEKNGKWSGKGGEWDEKEEEWSKGKKGKWSEGKEEKWSGKDDKW